MALTANRDTPEMALLLQGIAPFEFGVAATTHLYAGALACLNAGGDITKGAVSASLIALGRVEKEVNNTGGAGDVTAKVKPGIFRFDNTGATLTSANRGDVCYIASDSGVQATDAGGTLSKAGVVVDVDSDGVWVAVGFQFFSNPAATPSGTLQKVTVTVDEVDLIDGDDGDAQDVNVGAVLPAGAVLLSAQYTINEVFAGAGVATLTMIVGYSGDTNGCIEAVDIFGDAAATYGGVQGTAMGLPAGGKQIVANFDPDNAAGLDELTAGNITIDVFYFVAF